MEPRKPHTRQGIGGASASLVPIPASLALLCLIACGPNSDPRLLSFTPATVNVSELPVDATVEGEHLNAAIGVSLDSNAKATIHQLTAKLGDTELSTPLLQSSRDLDVTVPEGMAPGVYDFTLSLGPGVTVTLEAALSITQEGADATLENVSTFCDIQGFGMPEQIIIGDFEDITGPALTSDSMTLYFAHAGGLWTATRSDRSSPFQAPRPLSVFSPGNEPKAPYLSSDGLSLYVSANLPGGVGDQDLYVLHRSSTNLMFGSPTALTELNSDTIDEYPWVSEDEEWLIFLSHRSDGGGSANLWNAHRTDKNAEFEPPELLRGVNTNQNQGRPFVTPSGLDIYFASQDAARQDDIWHAHRESLAEDFSGATPLPSSINTDANEVDVTLSADGQELFFVREDASDDKITHLYRAVVECL